MKNAYFAIEDIKSSIVVLLVALPLCLGIAVASEAPPITGILSGIVGGLLVGALSASRVGVSGPAAGLTVVVATAIADIGSFQGFLVAIVLAGLLQFIMGIIKAGIIRHYFPSAVIKGMLAGIGVILILKQLPHAVGWDANPEGDQNFVQPDGETTFSEIGKMLDNMSWGAVIVTLTGLFILILWETKFFKKNKVLQLFPGPLVAVLAGVGLNQIFMYYESTMVLTGTHLVNLPINGPQDAGQVFVFPDFNYLKNGLVWKTAGVIALIASLETLLCVEATDKIDPQKEITPPNRELKAQGIGNMVVGLIGGLPVTQVIVRSSANLNAGAKTKASAVLHGILLVATVFLIPGVLQLIPLASLAAILLLVGYKLTRIPLIVNMFNRGWSQFLPFALTVIVIAFTDLLTGIGVGVVVSIFFLLRSNYFNAYSHTTEKTGTGGHSKYVFRMAEEISFLNKGNILKSLNEIPEGATVVLDFSKTFHLHPDVKEIIEEFKMKAENKNIQLDVIERKTKFLTEKNNFSHKNEL